MSLIKECRCEKKSFLRVDFALKSPALASAVSLSKSLSLANENSHDKSPSLAEGDLGGGYLCKNANHSSLRGFAKAEAIRRICEQSEATIHNSKGDFNFIDCHDLPLANLAMTINFHKTSTQRIKNA